MFIRDEDHGRTVILRNGLTGILEVEKVTPLKYNKESVELWVHLDREYYVSTHNSPLVATNRKGYRYHYSNYSISTENDFDVVKVLRVKRIDRTFKNGKIKR